jgi:zinc transporter ZupT
MNLTIVLFACATFLSTTIGGLFAIRFRDKLHLIMSFTAGVLLGVVFFDILPEIIEQTQAGRIAPMSAMVALVFGFLLFHVMEKVILIHHGHEEDYAHHHHPQVGVFSALALIGHSFMDGLGIALGFQVSPSVGALVAIAVISHDFTDGMNTVTLMLHHQNTPAKSKWFLLLDAIAPVLGALSIFWLKVPPSFLVLYLGFFAGFLLYIGASDILPEAHSQESSYKKIALTLAGVLLIFTVTRFV